ncbi:hypothetical protein DXG01_001104 [Tephrocybe rancida]|nr:hypothetical protein DXG01_001104 [Tephrocybe rancida]
MAETPSFNNVYHPQVFSSLATLNVTPKLPCFDFAFLDAQSTPFAYSHWGPTGPNIMVDIILHRAQERLHDPQPEASTENKHTPEVETYKSYMDELTNVSKRWLDAKQILDLLEGVYLESNQFRANARDSLGRQLSSIIEIEENLLSTITRKAGVENRLAKAELGTPPNISPATVSLGDLSLAERARKVVGSQD